MDDAMYWRLSMRVHALDFVLRCVMVDVYRAIPGDGAARLRDLRSAVIDGIFESMPTGAFMASEHLMAFRKMAAEAADATLSDVQSSVERSGRSD